MIGQLQASFKLADSTGVRHFICVFFVCNRWPNVTRFWTSSLEDCRSTLLYVLRAFLT